MDKIFIGKNDERFFNINQDSYIIINNEVQSESIEFNILDCKVVIIDMSGCLSKYFNFKNSEATLIEIINDKKINNLRINNDSSNIEYNAIDLYDEDILADMDDDEREEFLGAAGFDSSDSGW